MTESDPTGRAPGAPGAKLDAGKAPLLRGLLRESQVKFEASHDLLAGDELEVMDGLVAAWNAFVTLETLHPDETEEFRRAVHTAQHIIMSRPVQRQFNAANP